MESLLERVREELDKMANPEFTVSCCCVIVFLWRPTGVSLVTAPIVKILMHEVN